LTDLAKEYRLCDPRLVMGGINFAWLAVWVPSPDWPSHKLQVCTFFQVLTWSHRAWGRGVRAMPRLWILYPGICLTT